MGSKKTIALLGLLGIGAAAHAVTFSNIITTPAPVSVFTSPSTISAYPAGWTVTGPGGNLNCNFQYDAASTPAMTNVSATIQLPGTLTGLSTVLFTESFYELDNAGNEIGTQIGSFYQYFTAGSNPYWTASVAFTHPVNKLRAKKTFTLSAPLAGDYASVAYLAQTYTVPEPSTFAVVGLALVALRKRTRVS